MPESQRMSRNGRTGGGKVPYVQRCARAKIWALAAVHQAGLVHRDVKRGQNNPTAFGKSIPTPRNRPAASRGAIRAGAAGAG